MWQSVKLSHTLLRLSLAIVFLWFGIDKFFHPSYWLNAWVPPSVISIADSIGISSFVLMYGFGVFEILVGISLLSNMFIPLFSLLSVIFLVITMLVHGFNEIIVRDIGLIGGLLALLVWPGRQYSKL